MRASLRHPDRRNEILQEAAGIFAQKGYEGTPIRTIARACGITEAAIYRHFENKADLYKEVIRFKARQHDLRKDLESLRGQGTVEDALAKVARHIMALAEQDTSCAADVQQQPRADTRRDPLPGSAVALHRISDRGNPATDGRR